MVIRARTDSRCVIHRAVVLTSLVCCVLVFGSFVMFATDQLAGASRQQAQLVAAGPTGPKPTASPARPAQPRRFIDGAAHTLTAPFSSVVASRSPWVTHGIPAALALLVYGWGLSSLARFARRSA
jgi:hypothetical protein